MRLDKSSILQDLRALGISVDDNVFLTIDIGKVGFWNGSRTETLQAWVDILKELVGDRGSIVLAAYTSGVSMLNMSKTLPVFNRYSKPNSGALPAFIVKDSRAHRSYHPTNSVVGYGNALKEIFLNHNHKSGSYSVMGELARLPKSKHLMIGTLDKRNSPQSMHYAQEVLGITRKHPLSGLYGIAFIHESGIQRMFRRMDVGGCSSGGYKLFAELVLKNNLKLGVVGETHAAVMNAQISNDIAYNILKKNPASFICDDVKCFECRGHLGNFNYMDLLFFYSRNIIFIFIKAISKIGR